MRCLLVLSGLLALINAAGAQQAIDKTLPQNISCYGTVVDPAGAPVAGARVVLREWSTYRYSENPQVKEVKDVLAETTTGGDGSFHFESVPYRPFQRLSHMPTPWDVIAMAEGHGLAWKHLTSSVSKQSLSLALVDEKHVTGTILDANGTPIPEAVVRVVLVSAPQSEWYAQPTNPSSLDLQKSEVAPSATTSASGKFELSGLPAGMRVTIGIEHPNYAASHAYVATTLEPQPDLEVPAVRDGKSVMEITPVLMSGFTKELEAGGQVLGKVILGDTGQPAVGARLGLAGGNRSYIEISDSEGRFEFVSLSLQKLHLTVAAPESPEYLGLRIPLELDAELRHIEIRPELQRGIQIKGKVSVDDTGERAVDVPVGYVPQNSDSDGGANWTPARLVTTDEAGQFEIFVPPGPGVIRVGGGPEEHSTYVVPNFWNWSQAEGILPGNMEEVDVKADGRNVEVSLSVSRGLVIRGRVVDAAGRPVAGATAAAHDRFGRLDTERSASTDADGWFTLSGFPPQSEQLLQISSSDGTNKTSAEVSEDSRAAGTRTVVLDPISLASTGTITGSVVSRGDPLPGMRIQLSMVTKSELDGGFNSRMIEYAETGEQGRFTFENVEAGREFHVSMYEDSHTHASSQRFQLEPGQTYELPQFAVEPLTSFVAGVVVDPDGNPVPGVTVNASQRNGGSIVGGWNREPTGRDGRFRLNNLPDLPLQLMAYIRYPEGTKDRSIHFPARIRANPGDTDVRIILDPKLQRPLP